MKHTYKYNKHFSLESRSSFSELKFTYHTYGNLNAAKNNVVWVIHALTANSDVFDWWKGLFGENEVFNPKDYFIVCANNLGSCYGTTGPLSITKETGDPLFGNFPEITIKDMANSFDLLKDHLGIERIHTLIGGSQGGQIALEWVLMNKTLTENMILIATNAKHSPWGIAFNESQRMAIKADFSYFDNSKDAGKKGLAAARSIALLSYRGYSTYLSTQEDVEIDKINNYAAASYQRYQGEKLVNRFNPYSYVCLLNAMDSHNISRGKNESMEQILNQITSKTLIISISSDILFPSIEQKFLANYISNAEYLVIDSAYGHDGFLIETKKISNAIINFYSKQSLTQIQK